MLAAAVISSFDLLDSEQSFIFCLRVQRLKTLAHVQRKTSAKLFYFTRITVKPRVKHLQVYFTPQKLVNSPRFWEQNFANNFGKIVHDFNTLKVVA